MGKNYSDLENKFLNQIKKLIKYVSDQNRFESFIKNKAKHGRIFEEGNDKIHPTQRFENLLFEIIIETSVRDIPLYHYTTLEAVLNMLKTKKLWFSCIVGLNDRSELNYSDLSLGLKKDETINQQRIRFANERFLFSMSSKGDDLNQWRLYGNDGKGACLKYRINDSYSRPSKSKFNWTFGKVRYNKSIFDILKKAIQIVNQEVDGKVFSFQRFYNWRNFFKTDDYEHEKEHRILVRKPDHNFKIDWTINRYDLLNSYVEVPFSTKDDESEILILDSIILGPKTSDPDFEYKQWKHYCNNCIEGDIEIQKSAITHYR